MAETIKLNPQRLTKLRTIDSALTSYNIEMTEVTGGTFWKAYTPDQVAGTEEYAQAEALSNPASMHEYFPPIDLSGDRIRTLAKALGPVWIRTSGTWATKTYYDFDGHTNGVAPEGFQNVLTKDQWIGVLEFVKAVDGKLLISVANCIGIHNSDGTWNPEQAKLLFDFSLEYGVPISAAEFMNEPNLLAMSGAPAGYTLEEFCRDQDAFFRFVKENYPDVLLVGPAATCDSPENLDDIDNGAADVLASLPIISTRDIMKTTEVMPDIMSYHYYNGVSERGAAMGGHWDPKDATTEKFLQVCVDTLSIYLPIRDKYTPFAQLWVTESGEAACGGSTWASTYLDVIRTVNEYGRFTELTDGVIFHNTLASSDYGWLDHATHLPRPSYWATLLWSYLMGTTVYDTHEPLREGAHIYAHSRKDGKDGVVYVVINNSVTEVTTVELPKASKCYILSSRELRSPEIMLNGAVLKMVDDNTIPVFIPVEQSAGTMQIEPATVAFLVMD